jgi:hypothetical protein
MHLLEAESVGFYSFFINISVLKTNHHRLPFVPAQARSRGARTGFGGPLRGRRAAKRRTPWRTRLLLTQQVQQRCAIVRISFRDKVIMYD